MGSKGSQSTSTVQIPQDILNRYNSVNARAEGVANNPFQQYSTDPSAFVAQLSPTQQWGVFGTNSYANYAQPFFQSAVSGLNSANDSAMSYYGNATNTLNNAQNVGQGLGATSFNTLNNAQNTGQGLGYQSLGTLGGAQNVGSMLGGASLDALAAGNYSAAAPQAAAGQAYTGAYQGAQPYNAAAAGQFGDALQGGQSLTGQSSDMTQQALGGAQPYQGLATAFLGGGAQAVNPSDLDAASIQKYMDPYLGTVLQGTAGILNQQNQQQQAGQLGNAISSGAFGGDRAGIAAANLQQQQNLANSQIYSGILSQGYNNALNTASGQQALGLNAGQANRAALQGASAQALAIGNQGFNQGLSAAQQQGALGSQYFNMGSSTGQNLANLGNQIYGQGMGYGTAQQGLGQQLYSQGANNASQLAALGQQQFGQGLSASQQEAAVGNQLYGQGANTAAQQAALGNQLYTQGANTSAQQAGLGQSIYNTGAGTSAAMANLGTGAQSAGLQGAQAQLTAGQAEQQTNQAGMTALYNQFLQQQSYPFQVSQFLANIAMGTGALSGSTTSTNATQNGFFSDERLKEGAKPIGKTFDGQTIYSYRYKGEPQTQIGLMAQEVEKKHPEAVGSALGYKTVDYKGATDDAASRGKFAYGGGVGGLDPAMMQQMVANYQAMYGPLFSSPGGVGAGGIVPEAKLPVGQLQVAKPADVRQPGLAQQASGLAAAGNSIGALGDKLGAWDYSGGDNDNADNDNASGADPKDEEKDRFGSGCDVETGMCHAGGGRVGLAAGGQVIPYQGNNALKLDIPDEQEKYELQTPGSGQTVKNPNVTGGIKDLAQAGLAIAKMVPMISDRRAKQDIRPVGKTFDGQTVYSYKYKGDDATHMGLIAQEVEKKHPRAVGKSGKLKTVDYAKATGNAASRGKFAIGGATEDKEELDRDTLDQLLDTFAKEDEPGLNIERPDLVDVPDGMADLMPQPDDDGDVDFAMPDAGAPDASPTSISSKPEPKGGDLIVHRGGKGTRSDRNNNPGNIEAGSFARKQKGFAGSDGRFAVFETPAAGRAAQIALLQSYVNKGFDTPLKIANRWAPSAEKGNNPSNYATTIAKQLGIRPTDKVAPDMLPALAAAQAVAEGTSRARPSRAVGGAIQDIDPDIGAELEERRQRELADNFDAALAAKTEEPPIAPNFKLGAAMNPEAQAGLAAVNATDYSQPAGVAAAPAMEPKADMDAVRQFAANVPEALQNEMSVPRDVDPDRRGSFIKGLKRGDASSLIPLLTGFAAFGTANTSNPLTALATGLGAGAQSVQGQRQFDVETQAKNNEFAQRQQKLGQEQTATKGVALGVPYQLGRVGAESDLIKAQTKNVQDMTPAQVAELQSRVRLNVAQEQGILADRVQVGAPVLDGSGNVLMPYVDKITGKTGTYTIPGGMGGSPSSPTSNGVPAPAQVTPSAKDPWHGTPKAPESKGWKPTTDIPFNANPAIQMVLGPEARARDGEEVRDARQIATDAGRLKMTLGGVERGIASLPENGFLSGGYGIQWRTNAVRGMNAYLNTIGAPPIGNTDQQETVQQLTQSMMQRLKGHASGSVLSATMAGVPSGENSKIAAQRLISGINQGIEYERTRAEAMQKYFARGGTLQGFQESFDKANPPENFARRAIMNTVPREYVERLRQNKANPVARRYFDQRFGAGTASMFIGGR